MAEILKILEDSSQPSGARMKVQDWKYNQAPGMKLIVTVTNIFNCRDQSELEPVAEENLEALEGNRQPT